MTYKYTLERSLEEQKCRNVELESKAVVFKDKEAMLNNKVIFAYFYRVIMFDHLTS